MISSSFYEDSYYYGLLLWEETTKFVMISNFWVIYSAILAKITSVTLLFSSCDKTNTVCHFL